MVYAVSSRPARATWRDLVSTKQTEIQHPQPTRVLLHSTQGSPLHSLWSVLLSFLNFTAATLSVCKLFVSLVWSHCCKKTRTEGPLQYLPQGDHSSVQSKLAVGLSSHPKKVLKSRTCYNRIHLAACKSPLKSRPLLLLPRLLCIRLYPSFKASILLQQYLSTMGTIYRSLPTPRSPLLSHNHNCHHYHYLPQCPSVCPSIHHNPNPHHSLHYTLQFLFIHHGPDAHHGLSLAFTISTYQSPATHLLLSIHSPSIHWSLSVHDYLYPSIKCQSTYFNVHISQPLSDAPHWVK